jgi:hypothetical protein
MIQFLFPEVLRVIKDEVVVYCPIFALIEIDAAYRNVDYLILRITVRT